MAAPSFRTGAEQAEQAAARVKFGRRVDYLSLDDGEYIDLRFVSDGRPLPTEVADRLYEWITVGQHIQVPTRPAPPDLKEGQKWPAKMGAVCRRDSAFAGIYNDCYVCDTVNVSSGKVFKVKQRTFGLAIVREPVVDERGAIVGLKDKIEEVEIKDGDSTRKVTRPQLVIVNQAWSTFWGHYSTQLSLNGTVLDRDFRVTRKGTEMDTDYPPAAFDKSMIEIDGEQIALDFRDPRVLAHYDALYGEDWLPDLGEIVGNQASDDYYARFIDPTKPFPQREGGGDGDGGQATQKPPANEPSDDELAALAARVQGQAAPPAQEPAQQPMGQPTPI